MEKIDLEIQKTLKEFFGFKKFKGNQKKAIESIINGENTFVIMPTGGGKSLCYQLPALILDGVAIIISPLIALMKNQVDSIKSYSDDEDIAHFLNSTLSKPELEHVKSCVLNGKTKLLFVAPETISKEKNLSFFQNLKISFFAIDEAHCISEWGHDFRPEYRKLKSIIKLIGRKPIIALTATATPKVKEDIIKNLGIENNNFFLSSFNRTNLYYEIKQNSNRDKEIVKFIKSHSKKSGIIYCLSRKKAEEVSELLTLNNINSRPYHAGLEQSIRKETQENFLMEKTDVIVATIAFGMGIDKPDVRYVIHYNLPKSLENYYQETGRAGRDGGEGKCILYYDPKDVEKFEGFITKQNNLEKEINRQLLEEIVSYVESNDCRRKKILHYFGEKYNSSHCNKNCDNCLHPQKMKEVKRELDCVLNIVNEKPDNYNIIDITSMVSEKLENVDIFLIKQIIRQAIIDNLLTKSTKSFGKLSVTHEGENFLKSSENTFIKIKSDGEMKNPTSKSIDTTLFSILEKTRQKIAKEKNVPAFIIFQDPSLEDMTLQYPTTIDELKNIFGVGHGKAKKYGEKFIAVIKQYVEENEIMRVQDYIVKSKPKKNDLKIFIIQAADKKLPFDEIIEQKDITMEFLIEEIESIINSGTKININYHIEEILEEEEQKEIYDYFLYEAENESIESATEYFEDEYNEEELRLMKIKLLADLAH